MPRPTAATRLPDPPEHAAAALLLDREADELERVVLVLVQRGQLVAGHGERRAAGNRAVEADHRPPLCAVLRSHDLVRLVADMDRRAAVEGAGAIARTLDEERAVETVRASDAADRNELRGHVR
jgi:hypothetical protein